jgi:hypothetical protein
VHAVFALNSGTEKCRHRRLFAEAILK